MRPEQLGSAPVANEMAVIHELVERHGLDGVKGPMVASAIGVSDATAKRRIAHYKNSIQPAGELAAQ